MVIFLFDIYPAKRTAIRIHILLHPISLMLVSSVPKVSVSCSYFSNFLHLASVSAPDVNKPAFSSKDTESVITEILPHIFLQE